MSSDPMLPSVPRTSRRRSPSSYPTDVPFAPGNVPNRLSKVLFSLMRKTTCSIGHRVLRCDRGASLGEAASVVRLTLVADGECDEAVVPAPGPHAAATMSAAIAGAESARTMCVPADDISTRPRATGTGSPATSFIGLVNRKEPE
jgi:hypothetical protein